MNVAYLAEPMVSYRVHAGNMTLDFKKRTDALVCDELLVLWGMKALAESARASAVARMYLDEIGWYDGTHVAFGISRQWRYGMSLEQFDESLDVHCAARAEREFIRSLTYSFLADQYREMGDVSLARRFYRAALLERPTDLKTRAKLLLLRGGAAGRGARYLLAGRRPTRRSSVTVRS